MSRNWRGLVLLAGLTAAVCARLGFWQLDRLAERRATNAGLAAARQAAPVRLVPGALGAELHGRRGTAAGTYDRAHEFVLRNAVYEGGPGVRVVTPLRLAWGDTAVLVDRGFMPAPDAVTADLAGLDEPGEQEVHGLLERIVLRADGGEPLVRPGSATWRGLDLAAVRAALPYPVAPLLLRQAPDSTLPDRPRRLEPARLDDGPHLAYAIQWFAFAAVAVGGAVAVAFSRTDRRRDRALGPPPPSGAS